ncbi:peptidoglycan-binding domain-containing protein [Streptomyces sp. NPDC050448]|uniref:peptidoglycan-binding domain-containing protein n=1 Tax=Streptomyces sp. NPDC050448 TaxID=3155404 RepID=UPI00342157C9
MKLRNARRALAGIGAAVTLVATFSGTANAASNAPYIGYGYTTSGPGVWCAQVFANRYGGYWGPIKEDGRYGPETQAAIKRFQGHVHQAPYNYPLTVDGIVGKTTGWAMLQIAHQDHDLEPYVYDTCVHHLPA